MNEYIIKVNSLFEGGELTFKVKATSKSEAKDKILRYVNDHGVNVDKQTIKIKKLPSYHYRVK